MADTQKNTRYDLNVRVSIEFILASLTKEEYKEQIDMLLDGIKNSDKEVVGILNKYKWLVENQLGGNVPSIDTLKIEFPTLNFTDVRPITEQDALYDYIHLFISKKRNSFISNKLSLLSDKVISQGITDDDTLELYDYLAKAVDEDTYEPITKTFKELYEKQAKLVGISFLSPELDSLSGGITPGQICTILGAPGSMKTTYSSNIAYGAIKSGKNVLYVSLEEPAMQLYSKWLSRCSLDAKCPIPQKDIVQRTLDEKQKNDLFNKVMPLFDSYQGKLYILDEQSLPDYDMITFESKFKQIDKLARQETGHGIDLVVVDHIQLLKFGVADRDTISTINMYVTFFRRMSLNWLHEKKQVAVILLSQANREGYAFAQKNDGQYQLQHVAEASEVERASAYIVSVYTDPMLQVTNQLTLYAVKMRGSPQLTSIIPIYADGSVYQVGSVNTATANSLDNTEEQHLSLADIDSMLEV